MMLGGLLALCGAAPAQQTLPQQTAAPGPSAAPPAAPATPPPATSQADPLASPDPDLDVVPVPSVPGPDIPRRIEFGPPPVLPAGAREVASPASSLFAAPQDKPGVSAVDLHRDQITITAWELTLLLRPAGHALAARAVVTVRNDSAVPVTVLPLQISSSLAWDLISLHGQQLPFTVHTLDTGIDHTAAAAEAQIVLPAPLAPGGSITLRTLYEGQIPQDSTRLERLGAPAEIAAQTDWDRIDGGFTGLRGMGNVLWYPVAAEPVLLGDGARLFDALGRWRARHAASTMSIQIRVDSSVDLDGATPDARDSSGKRMDRKRAEKADKAIPLERRPAAVAAILNGQRVPLSRDGLAGETSPRIANLPETPIGFDQPAIFLTGTAVDSPGLHVFPLENQVASVLAYASAMDFVRPAVEQWLPPQSRDISVAGLPGDGDTAFESTPYWAAKQAGPVLAAPMPPLPAEQIAPALAHTLSRASFLSPRPWLAEGVAQFMSTLWVSHEQTSATGMNPGLELLEDRRSALALAEPSNGAAGTGEPLQSATEDIFYRTKAAYVFWMLRGICGDAALISALKAYRPEEDTAPGYFEHVIEAASHKDLKWFFADWVDADKGLPDLKIANVISRRQGTAAEAWLVSVDVANDGYAAAEVPVRVDGFGRTETQRILVPGRGRATAHIILAAQPDSVTVNDGSTPETVATVHTTHIQPSADSAPPPDAGSNH